MTDLKAWFKAAPHSNPRYEAVQLVLQLASYQYLCDTELAFSQHWEFFEPVARNLLAHRRARAEGHLRPDSGPDPDEESSHSAAAANAHVNDDPDSDYARLRDPSRAFYSDPECEEERLRALAYVPRRLQEAGIGRVQRVKTSRSPSPRPSASSSTPAPPPPPPPAPPLAPDSSSVAGPSTPSLPDYEHDIGPCEQWCECTRRIGYGGLPRGSDASCDSRRGSDEPFSDEGGTLNAAAHGRSGRHAGAFLRKKRNACTYYGSNPPLTRTSSSTLGRGNT